MHENHTHFHKSVSPSLLANHQLHPKAEKNKQAGWREQPGCNWAWLGAEKSLVFLATSGWAAQFLEDDTEVASVNWLEPLTLKTQALLFDCQQSMTLNGRVIAALFGQFQTQGITRKGHATIRMRFLVLKIGQETAEWLLLSVRQCIDFTTNFGWWSALWWTLSRCHSGVSCLIFKSRENITVKPGHCLRKMLWAYKLVGKDNSARLWSRTAGGWNLSVSIEWVERVEFIPELLCVCQPPIQHMSFLFFFFCIFFLVAAVIFRSSKG